MTPRHQAGWWREGNHSQCTGASPADRIGEWQGAGRDGTNPAPPRRTNSRREALDIPLRRRL